MGITESRPSADETAPVDGITTVSGRTEDIDPLLQKLKALNIATPLLKSAPIDNTLKDLLLKRPSLHMHAGEYGSLDPATTAALLTLYHEWQRVTSEKINKNQEDLGNKIDIVEALAMKLLQRFNFSLNIMKTSATDLEDVHAIKTEVGQLKGKLREVLENYMTLQKKIHAEGPEFLKSVAKPVVENDFPRKSSDSLLFLP